MIRVRIADDHRLFAEGLAQALGSMPDMRVVSVHESADAVPKDPPVDVIITDLEMPGGGGLEILRRFAERLPVLVVTMHADASSRDSARLAGARAFHSKAAPLTEVAASIRAIMSGEDILSLTPAEADGVLEEYGQPRLDPGAASLTDREVELLRVLASGVSSTEELAEALFISQKTVKNHLASIFAKLAVTDRTQAAIEAIRLGLDKP